MSVNTRGFIHSENAKNFHNLKPLIDYIAERYELTGVYYAHWEGIRIGFLDGKERRLLNVFSRYTNYENEGFPSFDNTARRGLLPKSPPFIVLFDLGCSGNSDKIIKGIVQYFGGGYFIHNDSNNDWEIVEGKQN